MGEPSVTRLAGVAFRYPDRGLNCAPSMTAIQPPIITSAEILQEQPVVARLRMLEV